jgi:hypothetical protein
MGINPMKAKDTMKIYDFQRSVIYLFIYIWTVGITSFYFEGSGITDLIDHFSEPLSRQSRVNVKIFGISKSPNSGKNGKIFFLDFWK